MKTLTMTAVLLLLQDSDAEMSLNVLTADHTHNVKRGNLNVSGDLNVNRDL